MTASTFDAPTPTLPPVTPPPVAPDTYQIEDQVDDPALARERVLRAEAQREESKSAQERLLDIPVGVKIGGKDFAYSARPIGYLHLVFRELARLGPATGDVLRALENGKSGEEAIKATLASIDTSGPEVTDALAKIGQLLVEPIDPSRTRPPLPEEFALGLDAAKWHLTTRDLARLVSAFYVRDLLLTVGSVKNLIGLGPKS